MFVQNNFEQPWSLTSQAIDLLQFTDNSFNIFNTTDTTNNNNNNTNDDYFEYDFDLGNEILAFQLKNHEYQDTTTANSFLTSNCEFNLNDSLKNVLNEIESISSSIEFLIPASEENSSSPLSCSENSLLMDQIEEANCFMVLPTELSSSNNSDNSMSMSGDDEEASLKKVAYINKINIYIYSGYFV